MPLVTNTGVPPVKAHIRPQAPDAIDWRPYRLLAYSAELRKGVDLIIREYNELAFRVESGHGVKMKVKVLKDLYGRSKLLALGVNVPRESYGGMWLATNRHGIPRGLPNLTAFLTGGVWEKRIALSVLSAVEVMRLPPSSDISTITGEYTGKVLKLLYWKWALRRQSKRLFARFNEAYQNREDRYHLSTSAGPNHGASIIDSGLDALFLNGNPEFKDLFLRACDILGRDDLLNRFTTFVADAIKLGVTIKDPRHIAQLYYLPDKAGKTRVVYALTWWFQELLNPLHKGLYRILDTLDQDGTSSHDKAAKRVQQWTLEGRRLWSVDLTAATDRFPVALQRAALEGFLDASVVEIWSQIMALKPWSKPHNRYVSYAVGQPMGSKTSWAAFALTHHTLLHALCERHGVSTDLYVIIGDDIVIANDDVAKSYMQTLQDIGVDFSPMKTISPDRVLQPDKGNGNSVAEFAKRLFCNGLELTPLTSQLFQQVWTNHAPWLFLNVLIELERKWGVGPEANTSELHFCAPANSLYRSLSKDWQRKIAIVITFFPLMRLFEVKSSKLSPVGRGEALMPNPWVEVQELTQLQLLYTVLGDDLSKALSKLYELILILKKGGRPAELDGKDLVHIPSHPIYLAINRLDEVTKVASEKFSNGELSFSDVMDLGLDIGYLIQLYESGMSYKSWRDLKDRRSRKAALIALKIWKGSQNPSQFYDDYIE